MKLSFCLVHCKCTSRTSNKSGLSLEIIPIRIDEKSKDQLPHLLKILTIELQCLKMFLFKLKESNTNQSFITIHKEFDISRNLRVH